MDKPQKIVIDEQRQSQSILFCILLKKNGFWKVDMIKEAYGDDAIGVYI